MFPISTKVFVKENFNRIKEDLIEKDPVSALPMELVREVFSHLDLAMLGTVCRVSKKWKQLASEPILWKSAVYREIAFGNAKWAHYFGKDSVKDEDNQEELASLPLNDFIADCKKFKSLFPDKKAKDRLMLVRIPKTLNGKLTLKSLKELIKRHFPNKAIDHNFIDSATFNEIENQSTARSCWVLMTRGVLETSKNKSYAEQKATVADLAQKELVGYEIPNVLESAVCLFSQHLDSSIPLFNNEFTIIRSKEEGLLNRTAAIGNSPNKGLTILLISARTPIKDLGVAVLRKF